MNDRVAQFHRLTVSSVSETVMLCDYETLNL